jgi:hypothetical protein
MANYALVFAVLVVALVAATGCIGDDAAAEDAALQQELARAKAQAAAHKTSSDIAAEKKAAEDAAKPFALSGVSHTENKYGWTIVSGTVENHTSKDKNVAIYVDFYNAAGAKIDHVLDYVSVDAYGKSTFEATCTKGGAVEWKYYIDHTN